MFSYRDFCQVSNLITVHELLIQELSREVGGRGRGGLVGEVFLRSAHSLLLGYVSKQSCEPHSAENQLRRHIALDLIFDPDQIRACDWGSG